jgi:hypothetical protein
LSQSLLTPYRISHCIRRRTRRRNEDSNIADHARANLDFAIAISYIFTVLDMMSPTLMRPIAAHNVAAIGEERYCDILLPALEDVRRMVMQTLRH